ncbi:hypothetical protein WN944_000166 [Citrus x changshan-huyou]|uniref:Uncharacterized protein n=1 Tax=Citrus x changshan-huyou TaxID=2935761 RepID=A0AAP0QLP0_9ROSI
MAHGQNNDESEGRLPLCCEKVTTDKTRLTAESDDRWQRGAVEWPTAVEN